MNETPPMPDGANLKPAARTAFSRRGVALAILLAAGGLGAGCNRSQPAGQGPVPALTVTAASPRSVDWPVTLSASGAIAPWQEASIGAQIGGYQLIEVRVNVGDRVRRGQVLARLDPALLRAEEAQLLANSEQAEANRARALALQGSGGISDQEVLRFVTEARTAAAALAGVRTRLRYANVVAPDNGTISARTATLGAVAPAGQELFRLIRRDRLEWRGQLTAEQLARIRIGQEIKLRLPGGDDASATVRQVAPSLDDASRLGLVYADIRPGSRGRAGMFAEGDVGLAYAPALVVPAESVIIRDGRSRVLVLADASATPRVALRSVTVGRRGEREVEITQGLRPGERVVVRGAGFLKDRDLVRVASAPRPAGAARP